ncbi:MAG: hypothetical protein ACFFCH_00725 [Promethearchaeota archaeon]
MPVISDESLNALSNRILSRLDPEDRSYALSLIQNIIIFIKRIQGQKISEEEEHYPRHPLFSHSAQKGGQDTAKTLLYRLRLVDQYHLDRIQCIIDVVIRNIPFGGKKPLSSRKAQILWQLYQNPMAPKYKLAKQIGTTPRTLSKDIAELERDYAFRIFTSVDSHKFHLIQKIIVFETKSIAHTRKLADYATNHRGFLRSFRLDQDMRRGTLIYRYPNQKEGNQLFEARVDTLLDELFIDVNITQVFGIHQFISFEMYNPLTYDFSIEPEIVSQVPFDYSKSHLDTLPQPRGLTFTKPFWFDQADFLLADTLYSSGTLADLQYKQRLLRRYGIEYSTKTIWKKQQRLRKENVGFPTIELQIPGFDEDLVLVVFCTPKAASSIRAISVFLPYVMIITTDSGCLLRIQRPVHTATLTGQLIRKIHNQRGVRDVKLLRYQGRLQTPLLPDIVHRWNTDKQKWMVQEEDI